MMIRNIILIDNHDKLLNLETVQPQAEPTSAPGWSRFSPRLEQLQPQAEVGSAPG